jgi:hypothetical protein
MDRHQNMQLLRVEAIEMCGSEGRLRFFINTAAFFLTAAPEGMSRPIGPRVPLHHGTPSGLSLIHLNVLASVP